MKIAQIAPLYESVPPKYYGGTERVVSYLTEALVREGHDVTLFASGDSVTKARLVAACHRSLRLDKNSVDSIAHHVLMMERVYQQASDFDIIHNHNDYFPFSLARRCETPTLTTLHGRLNIQDLVPIYEEFSDMAVVSVSNAQREPFPSANWQGTVYHGLPKDCGTFQEKPGKYLAFLGRICPEKRVDRAIKTAIKCNIPLKIAAKVDKVDREYYEQYIVPMLDHPLIDYLGEIGEGEKDEFLGKAMALMFPIDWPEPFGLAMIEAMACGTPIIARRCGSVPEVLEEGVTGFIVDDPDEAASAVTKVHSLSRKKCREVFEERFTDVRMANDYVAIYEKLIRGNSKTKAHARIA